ncbi:S8 family peptidase [Plebeiibacterium sediminum]|nr:S8 family serine peptidase [Plebeiobacterium sediminum]
MNAQKYFIAFTDKANNTFSTNSPEAFLSQRAMQRRAKQNINITEEDLPVSQFYLDSLKKMNVNVLWPSKWLNGAIIETNNTTLIDTITRVSFISDARLIWKSNLKSSISKFQSQNPTASLKSDVTNLYGQAYNQTVTINGHLLHQEGYEGKGMLIAVIDNGFGHADELPAFNHLWNNNQIKASVDIVSPGSDVFHSEYTHGMYVLSVLGGYLDGEFKGAATEADYILLRTEDDNSEYPIEEYNWVIAAEYADSAGVDVINSSLGYYEFNDATFNHTYEDMDGQTTICVTGAEKAFSKGMLVVNSAGNEGSNPWKYIITPADGKNILSVAAMVTDSTKTSFSSYGPSYDGRVKPDITALGAQAAVQGISGSIIHLNGTSFSAPIIAGFATCLWQAKPNISNKELLQIIKRSSHQYYTPDDSFGYGIANFYRALDLSSSTSELQSKNGFRVTPNPFSNKIEISHHTKNLLNLNISIYDITGNIVYQENISTTNKHTINNLDKLCRGMYVLQLKDANQKYSFKIIKTK